MNIYAYVYESFFCQLPAAIRIMSNGLQAAFKKNHRRCN